MQPLTIYTNGEAVSADEPYTFHMVTAEFAGKTEAGKEMESYRWHPGTIMVPKGKEVIIQMYGVNGLEHPFYIEGTDYQGVVQKGKETELKVKFDKKGTYRLICSAHSNIQQNGPMIAYITVD